mgnify:CR=1 FL=1|jgi:hypothetical protein
MNKYIHVIDENGCLFTSTLVLRNEAESLEIAKKEYPDMAQFIPGDDNTLNEFLRGKIYKDGQFAERPRVEFTRTKTDEIAAIKAEYEPRFKRLKDAILQRALIGATYTDIQAQYKKLTAEMATAIKGVK